MGRHPCQRLGATTLQSLLQQGDGLPRPTLIQTHRHACPPLLLILETDFLVHGGDREWLQVNSHATHHPVCVTCDTSPCVCDM